MTATPHAVSRGPYRDAWVTAAVLAVVTAAAWVVLVTGEESMGFAAFLAAWLVMMAAMMLPSAAPLVLVYRRGASTAAAVALVAGYLAVWAAAGLGAYALDGTLEGSYAAAAILAVAAAYELTPVKARFLRVCRSPLDFLMTRWRATVAGAARLGAEHGVYCLGCCWALMAVLVVAAAMGLGWAAAIALAVFAEKVLPAERFWRWVTAAALLAFAVATLMM